MSKVKRTATVGGYYIETSDSNIEIYSIAPDGSGRLSRVEEPEKAIRELAAKAGFERDYNISYRQYVARLIMHLNKVENKKL